MVYVYMLSFDLEQIQISN